MEREAYSAMAEIEGSHWWFVGRRAIIRSLIEHRVAPRKPARVLEAGCGTGGNLALLGDFGAVEAIEYDEAAREIARAKSGLDVKAGSLPDGIDHIDGAFDLVALFDVLEHLEKDEESLRSLAARLAPGGKLVLTVPALQFLWSSHDKRHHHHRRYSRASLSEALTRAGLRVEYMSYFNSFLFPAAMAQRLLSRFSKGDPALNAMPPKPVNALLTRIFASERALLRYMRLPIGLSLCAVCSAEQEQ